MKKIGLLLFLLALSYKVQAQYFSKAFDNTFIGDLSISQTLITNDSNIAVFGMRSVGGLNQTFFIKMNFFADTIFTRTYSLDNPWSLEVKSVQQSQTDSSYYIAIANNDASLYGDTSKLIKTDKFGNIVWYKDYSISQIFNIKLVNNDTIYLTGDKFLKLDTSGTILSEYYFDNSIRIADFIIDKDNDLVGIGYQNSPSISIVYKMNNSGQLIWSYSSNFYSEYFSKVTEAKNGQYWVISSYADWNLRNKSSVLLLDPNGNYIGTQSYNIEPNDSSYFFSSIVQLSNGNAMINGSLLNPQTSLVDRNFKLDIDSNANLIDYKINVQQTYSDKIIEILLSDSIIIRVKMQMVSASHPSTAICYMMDTICTSNLIQHNSPATLPFSITAGTNSIGIVNQSYRHGSGILVSAGCIGANITEANAAVCLIFPNPVNTEFTISSKQEFLGSKFTLTNILGKSIITGSITSEITVVNIDILPPGLYLLNFEKVKGTVFKVIKN